MKISGLQKAYSAAGVEKTNKKAANIREYSRYLTQKFPCLTPGTNAGVDVTPGLMRKAMNDEKTGAWLERELSKAPDYIREG